MDFLQKHMGEMHREGRQRCPECGKEFANGARLEAHLRMHQEEVAQQVPTRDQICPICGRGFIEREALAKHLRFVFRVVFAVVAQLCNVVFSV